jgi:hypothetical protein
MTGLNSQGEFTIFYTSPAALNEAGRLAHVSANRYIEL